jgi:hypothetical protein
MAEQGVQRPGAGSGQGKGGRGQAEERRVFVSALGGEEPVRAVHRRRGDHRSGGDRARGRCSKAGRDHCAATRLGEPRGDGVGPAGLEPHLVEGAGGGVESVTAEPPEQLLGPVDEQHPADTRPQGEQSGIA